jgi:transposase
MSTVNKLSLREEVERIKNEFDQLAREKKINPETRMLCQSMLMLINLLVSIFLEKTTKKTSKNSSIPPSQTEKDESSTQPGTNGKGKHESDSTIDNTRTVETVTIATVEYCDVCGEGLNKVAAHSHERRTKIDIVFEKILEHYDAEKKICPNCDSEVKGTFPSDMHGPLQYGDGIKAYIINLLVCQMVSLNRVQKMVKTLIGTLISEATLLNFVLRLHHALEALESKAVERLLKCPTMNVDETSLRLDKQKPWIHLYSGDDITLKFLHTSRGSEAINDIDIIPRYGGVIIHDYWSSYLMYDHCEHGLCGSHLLRELTYVIDSNGYS